MVNLRRGLALGAPGNLGDTVNANDQTPIFTIGHGGRTADQFLALLEQHHIGYLIDVRSVPFSKYQPEFNQDSIEPLATAKGIQYLAMGDSLGGRPKDPTCYLDGAVDYELCRTKDWFQKGIARLKNAASGGHRVALLCSELRPEMCHRTKLIGRELTLQGSQVVHIDETDALAEQGAVLARITGGQAQLFGDDGGVTLSRKRYRP